MFELPKELMTIMGALGREETKAFRVLWTDLRPFDKCSS